MGKGKTKSKAKIKQKQKAVQKSKNIAKKQKQVFKKQSVTKGSPQKPPYSVVLGQINTLVGDVHENARKVIAVIEKAKEQGAQLVVFPELTLTGCPPKDLLLRSDFVDVNMQRFIEVVNACKGISCVFGFVNKANKNIYNAVAFVKDQKILGIQNKTHLVSADGFDERRYFSEGSSPDVVMAGNMRLGIVISYNPEQELTIQGLVQKGVDLLVVVAASPYSLEKTTELEITGLAKRYQTPVMYCNSVGAQDNLIFEGGSFAVDKNGLVISRARKFTEELLLVDANKTGSSFTPSKDQASELYAALTIGLRDYFMKSGHTKAVVGISGGLDSAVTATLAVHALGKENVTGLLLPSKMTSKESMADAKKICGNLGIAWKSINIDPIVLPTARTVGMQYDKKNISLTEQNIQSRVRSQIIMSFANNTNALVLATTNKTDVATGYFTLYGECTGALAPLADLWKTQVVLLAQFLNALAKQKQRSNVIPDSILKKQPTAELRPGQKDSDDLPSYDILDKLLSLYIVHKKDIHEIVKLGFDAEMTRRIAFMVMRNEFKRQQIPLPLRVSTCSFGPSWRYPIVSGWRG